MSAPEMGAMIVGIWIGAALVVFLTWAMGCPTWCS